MSTAALLNLAFAEASQKYYSIYEQWIKISTKVGGRLPQSMLMGNIQRYGRLDLLLRAIEDELHLGLRPDDVFTTDHLSMFSELWIGGEYEIFRLLRQQKLSDDGELFARILKLLELLRMPIEKHEIAKDKRLDEPLLLQRSPANNDSSDHYEYSKVDDLRAHIMPAAISTVNGSMMWQAIDLTDNSAPWIERRWLSDRMLELWSS
jgi:hypothetical protein